jgi:hypothetical protein
MPALASALRKTLENTVVKARDLAERGAREALTGLAVEAKEPFGSMGEEDRRLRNRLRARGRQLGDQRDAQKGTQSIERLVREMAYEHWHRMLFTRFLAENQLLIEPSSGVAVSLAECEELAAEEGTDLWELAANYAQVMLPEIFRTDDPVLALRLPLEIRQQLQALVAGLESEVFTASDSLGWTYQFWQTKRKKEVNDSGVKIGADELSPVTQLFTEDYMVDFLLDNTLGSWHAGKVLAANPQMAATAQSEEDLRQAVSLPDCPWNYLRFVKSEDGAWTPAAGVFEGWPKAAAELKCLDPCMGSGHFVVAMFERLVALRKEEEGRAEKAAVTAVIEDNLFGLEIDPRCTQIAAFNLALAAWRRVGHCKLPAMNLACSGLAPNTRETEWLAIAGGDEKLQRGMERLYRMFQKASVLGSLINPRSAEGDLLVAAFHELQPLLERALASEGPNETTHEMGVTARGLAKAAEILAGQFTLVATNVPYLGRPKQEDELMHYCYRVHPKAKADLATCFVERSLSFCNSTGSSAVVAPQNWLFLGRYKALRETLLSCNTWRHVGRLGTGAFETISGEIVNVALLIINRSAPSPESTLTGLDVSSLASPAEKASSLLRPPIFSTLQSSQRGNPDAAIILESRSDVALLNSYGNAWQGVATSDIPRFQRMFWEVARISDGWHTLQSTVDRATAYGGREAILFWQDGYGAITEVCQAGATFRGKSAWDKKGVVISQMTNLAPTLYSGDKFDCNCAVITLNDTQDLLPLWCYVESGEYTREVRKINKKLNVTNSVLSKIPFDLDHWRQVAAQKYPNGLPRPFSSSPTQWIFNGCPPGAEYPLHVAVARLLGYLWPRQTGSSFVDCPALSPDGLEQLADYDGLVCLSPARGEAAAADRLRSLLAAALGDGWSSAKERELLLETAVAFDARKAAADLGDWLRQNFFAEHCKLFQSRPFIWQI